jgi:protein tyrosine/serine phosphatase
VIVLDRPDQHQAPDGCCNFRDVGGRPGFGGARVRRSVLFRSDSLAAASDADRRTLAELALATVIDLRSHGEAELSGRYAEPGPVVHRLPLGNPMHGMATSDWDDPHRVAARYLELLLSGTETIAETLAVLTDPRAYPAVVHCSVGKDRTGVVVAVILSLLGVGDDDIVADYTLSGMGAARLALRLREHFVDRPGDLEPLLPALLSAHPDSMRIFLEQVRTKFGSVEGFVDDIGLSSAIGYLREALLEH